MEYKIIDNDKEKKLFIEAWEDAFDRKFQEHDYNWIFNERNNVYGIFDDGKVVAGYCLIKNKVLYKDEILEGALCNNVFVVKSHQGYNLFIKLGKYALKEAAESGVQFALGMPNDTSLPGHMRVGWTVCNKNYFLEKKITNCSEQDCDELNKNLIAIDQNNYDMYSDKMEEFFLNIIKGRTFSVLKSDGYFKWRYLERPSVDYKIFILLEDDKVKGYIVYKIYEPLKRLHIVDVEAEDKDVLLKLINVYKTFKEDFQLINTLGSTIYKDYLIEDGFKESEEYCNLIALKPTIKEKIELGDKVNIVLGDNEVF